MSGLEGRILTLIKELEEEKRLADKRAKQLYLAGASFIGHDDTPAAYASQAGKFVKVNAVPDALVFANIVAGDLPSHGHAWVDVSKTGSNLTDLATRQHAGLTNITSDQHHPQLHAAAHHVGGGDLVNHDSLTGFLAAEHKSLPNTIAQVLSDHNVAAHNALSIDHGSLGGRGDDDHSQYYNAARHTKAVHDALLITVLGSGALAKDHGAAATDQIINVCYGTGNPPTANTTTIGTLFVKYTA